MHKSVPSAGPQRTQAEDIGLGALEEPLMGRLFCQLFLVLLKTPWLLIHTLEFCLFSCVSCLPVTPLSLDREVDLATASFKLKAVL